MSSRTITITRDGTVVVLRGWRVAQLARQAGLRPTYAGSVQGWMLDAHRLPNLIGWLEYRNIRYELAGVTDVSPGAACTTAGGTEVTPEADATPESQGSLW